jgi:DnaJ family protein C protein 8
VDRDNEVNRVLWAFKLNPYEKLNVRFDATPEDIRRAYRKASLMVHPDKCKHPQAAAAFEVLGQAQKELLDESRRAALDFALQHAREEVRKARRKETKHDTAVRLAALLDEGGREGVEAAWEAGEEFHARWRDKARELLASTEWRKRKLTARITDETSRAKEEGREGREKAKKARAEEKQWEAEREERVGSWRTFASGKPRAPGAKGAEGGIKPPKMKTEDPERRFVQRPVGEQLRPPPPKK